MCWCSMCCECSNLYFVYKRKLQAMPNVIHVCIAFTALQTTETNYSYKIIIMVQTFTLPKRKKNKTTSDC